MLYRIVPAPFQDIHETLQVSVNIGMGIGEGIANTGLGCQVDNFVWLLCSKQLLHAISISHVDPVKTKTAFLGKAR